MFGRATEYTPSDGSDAVLVFDGDPDGSAPGFPRIENPGTEADSQRSVSL